MIRLRLSLDQSSRQIDMVDSNAWKRSFLKVDLVVVVGLDSSFGIKFLDPGENLHPIRHFPEKKGNCMPGFPRTLVYRFSTVESTPVICSNRIVFRTDHIFYSWRMDFN